MRWSFANPIRAILSVAFYVIALTTAMVLFVSLTEPLLNPWLGINPHNTNPYTSRSGGHSHSRDGRSSSSSSSRPASGGPRSTTPRSWAPQTHYEVLGVSLDADDATLRRTYLRHAKAVHPDKTHHLSGPEKAEASARFAELKRSYEFLLLSDTRCAYDRVFLRPTAQQRERCLERQVERRVRRRREEEEDRRRAEREEDEARARAEEEERESLMAEVEGWMSGRGQGGGNGGGDDDNGGGGEGKGRGKGKGEKPKKKGICENELMIFPLNTLCRFIVDGSVGLFGWLRDMLQLMNAREARRLALGIW